MTTYQQRLELARQLEQARLDKQHAVERSDAWYEADARITHLSKAINAGQPNVDPLDTELPDEDGWVDDEDSGISFLVR